MKMRLEFLRSISAASAVFLLTACGASPDSDPQLVFEIDFESGEPLDTSLDPLNVLVRGNLSVVDSMEGKAFYFDGDTFLEVTDAGKLDGMKALTVQAWMKLEKAPDVGMGILSKRIDHNVSDSYSLFLLDDLMLRGRVNGGEEVISDRSVPIGEWINVALVFDPAAADGGHTRLYMNGALVATSTSADESVSDGDAPLWIGELNEKRGFQFKGWLDDVQIWRRSLTEEELRKGMGLRTM